MPNGNGTAYSNPGKNAYKLSNATRKALNDAKKQQGSVARALNQYVKKKGGRVKSRRLKKKTHKRP
jgi:hypothetical protein